MAGDTEDKSDVWFSLLAVIVCGTACLVCFAASASVPLLMAGAIVSGVVAFTFALLLLAQLLLSVFSYMARAPEISKPKPEQKAEVVPTAPEEELSAHEGSEANSPESPEGGVTPEEDVEATPGNSESSEEEAPPKSSAWFDFLVAILVAILMGPLALAYLRASRSATEDGKVVLLAICSIALGIPPLIFAVRFLIHVLKLCGRLASRSCVACHGKATVLWRATNFRTVFLGMAALAALIYAAAYAWDKIAGPKYKTYKDGDTIYLINTRTGEIHDEKVGSGGRRRPRRRTRY